MSERTIVTVLRTGSWKHQDIQREYGPLHVRWIQRQVEQWAPPGTRFVCLSDQLIPGVEVLPLEEDWPGWWSKMELFRLDLGPVLYLDLDTVIVGPLNEIMRYPHRFTTFCQYPQRIASRPDLVPHSRILCSGVMAWEGPRPDLYKPFQSNPAHWMRVCTSMPYCWGDQGFLSLFLDSFDTWEELFPGAVGSYKWDLSRGALPSEARLITFEGSPKPWEAQENWIPALTAAAVLEGPGQPRGSIPHCF